MQKRLIVLLVVLMLALAACDSTPTLPPLLVDTPTVLPDSSTAEPKVTDLPTAEPTLAPPTEATAVPVVTLPPAAGCLIAWAGDGSVSCQMEGGEIRTLVSGVTGVNTPRVSPSGGLVAFRVPLDNLSEQLWLVGVDGSAPRLLIDPTTIPAPETGFVSSIFRFEWLAGDSALLFSTMKVPVSDDIGMYLPYNFDLMTVDVANGTLQTLIAAGNGGMFYLSPNQQYVTVSRATALDLYSIIPSRLTTITSVPFPSIITYSEYNYMPAIFWSLDSSLFTSLVPSEDPLADLPYASLYRVGVDGAITMLSQPEGNYVFGGGSIQISPDGLWFAKGQYNSLGELELSLNRTDGSAAVPVATMQGLDALAWSTDSQYLAFTQTSSDTSGTLSTISTAGAVALVANSGRLLDARWLDGETFVYLSQDTSGWKLWFHNPGSGESLIGSGSETDAQFDFR
jgi:hypothetical protein